MLTLAMERTLLCEKLHNPSDRGKTGGRRGRHRDKRRPLIVRYAFTKFRTTEKTIEFYASSATRLAC
jgi:hypothetical protein